MSPIRLLKGERLSSVVHCVNLLTLDKGMVLRKLGSLPDTRMSKINNCLKAALELS
jgi:mRNA interferase MazF